MADILAMIIEWVLEIITNPLIYVLAIIIFIFHLMKFRKMKHERQKMDAWIFRFSRISGDIWDHWRKISSS